MKGLELSRAYYEEYGKPMIDTQLAQYKPYLAAGLVGEGSECLGFDDELSRDHDFGPAFCLWVPEELYAKAGTEMQRAYDSLPASYKGYTRITSAQGTGRIKSVAHGQEHCDAHRRPQTGQRTDDNTAHYADQGVHNGHGISQD